MKQLIVMMATIILGLGIGGIVMSFEDTAKEIGDSSMTKVEALISEEPAAE